MTATTFNVVLLAALIHASWNAIVKGSDDKLLTTVLITLGAAGISALMLPFLPAPAIASWPFLIASAALQVGYFVLVATSYRVADMSQVYPVMRGTAPLIVACVSVLFLEEVLSLRAWWGIGFICLGILGLALASPASTRRGTALALTTAVVIASYTLIDGTGARLSGQSAAYTLWLNLLTGVPFLIWLSLRRPPAFRQYVQKNWAYGLIGSAATLVSYGLVLWAMTRAPIPAISALREVSILFALAISVLILKERVGMERVLCAAAILAGAVLIRL